ncbi:unnamed protein product, partial [Heterosigma akashiwo]
MSPEQLDVARETIQEMIDLGVMRKSKSPYASCTVIVRKPDGAWRCCIDFRPVERDNEEDVHPLPERRIYCVLVAGQPLQKRVDQITTKEVDRTVKGIQSFLGIVNYYKGFAPRLSEIAEPLTRLTRKGADPSTEWGDEQDAAVGRIKAAFSNDTVLTKYNPSRRILLQTDASSFALGAVLCHYSVDEEGKRTEYPICFASRKMNEHQLNYSVTEKEGLAVLWAVELFRPML